MNSLINTARLILESDSNPVTKFAAAAHEEWRKSWIAQNGDVPRIKKNSDGTEGDINKPFNEIHPDWQKENLAAGEAAHEAIRKYGNDTEAAAEHIHNEWMKRNPKAEWNAAQHVPYKDLPEEEKEKDRVHVRMALNSLNVNETYLRLRNFVKDWDAPGMEAYDDM